MAVINCPKCNNPVVRAGFPVWVIVVAICFFPLGLLALLAGRKPSTCAKCGNTFTA